MSGETAAEKKKIEIEIEMEKLEEKKKMKKGGKENVRNAMMIMIMMTVSI
jgi:hypothetical protein